MHRLSLLLAILLVLPLLGSDSPKEYDDKVEIVALEGAWRLTEYQFDGKKTKPLFEQLTTYRSGTYARNDGEGSTFRGNYRIDQTRNPALLDTTPPGNQTRKWIYQIDGDTLRIAGLPSYVERPRGFNDDEVYVYTFKRVK